MKHCNHMTDLIKSARHYTFNGYIIFEVQLINGYKIERQKKCSNVHDYSIILKILEKEIYEYMEQLHNYHLNAKDCEDDFWSLEQELEEHEECLEELSELIKAPSKTVPEKELSAVRKQHKALTEYVEALKEQIKIRNDECEKYHMNFSQALEALKKYKKVARSNWCEKSLFLFIGNDETSPLPTLSTICVKTADEKLIPWQATHTDMLAEDWVIVE